MELVSRVKLWAEAVRELLLCASILVAAVWAAYTFHVAQDEKKESHALAQQEKQKDLARDEKEKQDSLRPQFIVSLQVEPLVNADGRYLKAIVTLENKGTDSLWIELGDYSLSLRKLKFVAGQEQSELFLKIPYQSYKYKSMLGFGSIEEINLTENTSTRLVYLAKVGGDIPDPIKVTFVATYRHAVFTQELLAHNYPKDTNFTAQANEYVFFNKH